MCVSKQNKKNSGFTLVELSVVLVIIGLIVGSIIFSVSLVETSKLKSTYTDVKKYESAFHNFRVRYGALPGDMRDAASYWPGVAENGNGNGLIGGISGWKRERLFFWEHLALGGMMKGTFTGDLADEWIPGLTVPASKMPDAAFNAFHADWYSHPMAMQIELGNHKGQSIMCNLDGAALTPAQAQVIDVKLDDGLPKSGDIYAKNANGTTLCLTGDQYSASEKVSCNTMFWFN